MAFPKTLNAAKAQAFTVAAAGDSVTEAGFVLTEEQVNNIEGAITASESAATQATADITRLNSELATAKTDKETAEANVTKLTGELATMTTERDKWKKEAEEYGAITGDPKETTKTADEGNKGKQFKSSFDAYAEEHGISRA